MAIGFTEIGRNFVAPKGRYLTAQRNALGCRLEDPRTLKGRYHLIGYRPFRGLGVVLPLKTSLAHLTD